MLAVNSNKPYKKPSQIRGERFLRRNNLLVPPEALSNIETVKRKARAIRLKEEYQRKYLTKGRSTSTRRSSQDASTARVLPVDTATSTLYSSVKRTLTFCITLWIAFLVAIVFCTLVGYYLRTIYY